jgi:hypothetical protein
MKQPREKTQLFINTSFNMDVSSKGSILLLKTVLKIEAGDRDMFGDLASRLRLD